MVKRPDNVSPARCLLSQENDSSDLKQATHGANISVLGWQNFDSASGCSKKQKNCASRPFLQYPLLERYDFWPLCP